MRAKAGFLIIIGLMFIVASVTADPLTGTSTSKSWVIANGVDTTEITFRVTNTSFGTSVQGAQVTFNVTGDPTGSMTPAVVITDASGTAKSTFKVNKKSGTAKIEARVSFTDVTGTYGTIKTFDQKIDHDTPYLAHFEYTREGVVASEVPFRISFTDQWGNPIDNRKADDLHTIRLHVHGPDPDDCGFNDGAFVHDISRTLDPNGNISVTVKLSSKTGPNTILMDSLGTIPEKIEWIEAVSRGPPYAMTQEIVPAGAVLPADGDPASKFTLKYTLFDAFGNPASDQRVWVNTTIAGEEQLFKSTSLGTIWVTYGPRFTTGKVTITATAVANTSVFRSQIVGFYNTTAVSMELTATPDSMASLDVNPATSADIMAKVMDARGNPVANERVVFSLGAASYTEPHKATKDPALAPVTTVTTDGDGFAIIKFYPGAFTTNITDAGYSPAATGNCTVTAVWNGQTKNIQLSWKNNPYLSVKTSLNPPTAEVNQTVEITVEVRGDGWGLRPDPIDVVLVTDRSGSMAGPKIEDAKRAAKTFNGEMSGQDRVGLVSIGGEMSTVDLTLSSDLSRVNTTIDGYSADGNTPFRSAIYYATKMIADDPRSGAVKALVFMTDGEWNVNGDPEGIRKIDVLAPEALSWPEDDIESSTDVVLWSKSKGIKIYTVGLGLASGSQAETDLKNYASKTGGKYYSAAASSDLIRVYTLIAGELKTTAGVNTVMNLNFDVINNVNGEKMPGSQVFSYNYTPYNPGPPVEGSTRITWQDGVTNVTDQRADWAADQKLDFAIGTMETDQVWRATIRLKTNQTGSFDVFAPGSQISFDGGKGYLEIPHTFLTVIPKRETTGMGKHNITLEKNPAWPEGEIQSLFPFQWTTTYDGIEIITERIYYSLDNGPWVQFDEKIVTSSFSTQSSVLNVEKLPPGNYRIKIEAKAFDAEAEPLYGSIKVIGPGKTYIKLE